MVSISIKFDTNGLELSADDRCQLARIVDTALQDSGDLWVGCLYTKGTITIHALVKDEKQALSVIRLAIVGHPVFFIGTKLSLYKMIT